MRLFVSLLPKNANVQIEIEIVENTHFSMKKEKK